MGTPVPTNSYPQGNISLLNPLSTNPTKWLNTLKQFVGYLRMNCLGVCDHFVKLALKGLQIKNFNNFNQ